MGKAGKALRKVLESYNISQSQLAEGLGVERPIVFRWYHEKIDPTAETVAEIVKVLNYINKSAANDFIQNYLGDLTTFPSTVFQQDLPLSTTVNVQTLSKIFDNTTNSYKYLFFLSLLDILRREKFKILSTISLLEIIVEMLANAWYPHNYFKLSFGKLDKIADKLDSLNLVITEPILKFKDTDKKVLRTTINSQKLDDIVDEITRYVSYRLIRPFFAEETRGLKDYDVNPTLINLANTQFDIKKPLYCFNADTQRDCDAIIVHQDWLSYLQENYSIVRAWIAWQWLNYMQQRNPNIPNVVNKLFMPQQRDSLTQQTKYWKTVLSNQTINCIYSQVKLDINNISLDHYLPWSFVAHDQLWNLVPTVPSINSAKSNNLPSPQYFYEFVRLQHLGLSISQKYCTEKQWHIYIEPYLSDLQINDVDILLDLEKLNNAYQETITPLVGLAERLGFTTGWFYQR